MNKPKGVYRRIFSYAFRYPALFAGSVFFSIFFVAAKLSALFLATSFFSTAFIEQNLSKISVSFILQLVGVAFIWALSHYLIYILSNSLSTSVMHDLRKDIYEKLVDLPISYYKKNRTGDILSRVLNDLGVIEVFFMNIMVELMTQPLTLIAAIGILAAINLKITLYFFALAPVIGLVLGGIGAWVQSLSHHVQKTMADVTSGIQETIYGIEVIKGFGVEKNIRKKFSKTNDQYLKSAKREIRVRFLGTPSSEFLGAMAVVVIFILGALSVQNQVAKPSEIVTFISLTLVLAEPLSKSTDVAMILRKLQPAASRIFEIIDSPEKENFSLPAIGTIEGRLSFDNISFGYFPGEPVLSGIKLDIRSGETIAIVGPSGSGKSTLLSLIPAFYAPDSGSFRIDGKDVREYSAKSIREQISIVTQENILFSGTILENIRLAKPDASLDEVYEAAGVANAHAFIERFPEGYSTMLGDKGTRLSGGEKQRIAFARAILRKPKILILDEATSSLDAESEHLIQSAMENILGKQTTIIVAHKLSTIAHADRIIVMEQGKISETGTHQELLDQGGIYQRLFSLQVSV